MCVCVDFIGKRFHKKVRVGLGRLVSKKYILLQKEPFSVKHIGWKTKGMRGNSRVNCR